MNIRPRNTPHHQEACPPRCPGTRPWPATLIRWSRTGGASRTIPCDGLSRTCAQCTCTGCRSPKHLSCNVCKDTPTYLFPPWTGRWHSCGCPLCRNGPCKCTVSETLILLAALARLLLQLAEQRWKWAATQQPHAAEQLVAQLLETVTRHLGSIHL